MHLVFGSGTAERWLAYGGLLMLNSRFLADRARSGCLYVFRNSYA